MKQQRLFPQTVGLFGILFLLIAAFFFGKMQGGFVPWFLFYAFLTIVFYEIIVYFSVLRGVKVVRQVSHTRLNAGGKLEVQLTFSRSFWFPLPWVWVADEVSETIRTNSTKSGKLLFPWFKQETSLVYECKDLPRGRHVWKNVTVQSGDLFGLIQREKEIELANEVLVYPKVQEIPAWHTVNEQNMGTSFAHNRVSEDVTSVIGVRDYVHGDRLSRIHWKATARGMGLKTKEFEFQTSNDFMFFLDRRTVVYGKDNHPLFERAVSLLASLSRYAVKRRFSAGLVSHGLERFVLSPTRNHDTLLRIYEHLAIVTADGQFPFDKTLLREIVYLPYGTTVVCVTPQLDPDFIGAVSELCARRIKVEIFWIRSSASLSNMEQAWSRSVEQLNVPVKIVHHDQFGEIVRGDVASA